MNFVVSCIPFFIALAFHLVCCVIKAPRALSISKSILMPLLALGVIVTCLTNKQPIPVILILGILFGMVGDIALLGKITPVKFAMGCIAFGLGHLFYMLILIPRSHFWTLPVWVLVVVGLVIAAIIIVIYFMLHKPKGLMCGAALIYSTEFVFIVFVSIAAIFVSRSTLGSFSLVSPSTYRACLGLIIFILSDVILSNTVFVKDFKYSAVAVMSMYSIGQFFIAWGLQ